MSAGKFGKYKAEVEERIERSERLALRNKVESDRTLGDIRGIEGRSRNENFRVGEFRKKKDVYQ